MPSVSAPSILIVGGGLTGAAIGRALRRQLPAESVVVWEALSAVGGRMHTERISMRSGAAGLADTGAQYVTVTDDQAVATAHRPLYTALLDAGVLRPMAGRIEGGRAADGSGTNYVAPAGVASIVDYLFSGAGLSPHCSRRAIGLRRTPPASSGASSATRGGRWEVSTSDGFRQSFDGVVLTQPAPEILALLDSGEAETWLDRGTQLGDRNADGGGGGDGAATVAALSRSQLEAVEYSARFALTLFFPAAAAATFTEHLDWAAKYVTKAEDDALVYLAVDSTKRRGEREGAGGAADDAPEAISLVAHTSVPFGLRTFAAGTAEAQVCCEVIQGGRPVPLILS